MNMGNVAVLILCAFAAGFGAALYWRGRPTVRRCRAVHSNRLAFGSVGEN